MVQAKQVACRNDLRGVYRVVNLLAPKRRYEPVRIRSKEGHVLNHSEQFRELLQYFRIAFARDDSFRHSPSFDDLQLDVDVVRLPSAHSSPVKLFP